MVAELVTTVAANLRKTPSFGDNVAAVLPLGTIVIQDSFQDPWYYVIRKDATPGYLHASVVKEYVPPLPPPPLLAVPYKSQWANDANQRSADCGQTCVAMVAAFFGQDVAPNQLIVASDLVGHTTAADLIKNFEVLGLKAHIAYPVDETPPKNAICLVWYGGFDRAHVQDVAFKGLHWVVFLGVDENTDEVIVHDPDWWAPCMSCGDRKRYTKVEWAKAFIPIDGINVRQVVICDG